MYRWLVRPLLFTLPPSTAHAAGQLALGPIEYAGPLRALLRAMTTPKDPRLAVDALGLRFPSPVGLAGGFDKDAKRPRALAALGFGFLELGTVTAQAQAPNPQPNLFRLPEDHALVNRLGFPNEGAAAVLARLAHKLGVPWRDDAAPLATGAAASLLGVPVGVSIGKSRVVEVDPVEPVVLDYLASFRLAARLADFVVVNVSSPNTKNLRALQGAELARVLLSAITDENRKGPRRVPLLVKIAPDLADADIEALLDVVEAVGLDGVIATNTTIQRASLKTSPATVEAIGMGGLSGPPLRARALDVVRRVRARLPSITLIGVGGIETGEDALAYLRAGADLVQLYTGFIYEGPFAARHIASWLSARMSETGARSLRELAGRG